MTREKVTLADEKSFVNVLYYGLPKSGKTTEAASVAKLGETVYIDAEAGLKAGPLTQLFGIPVANIEPHREITYDALDALFWAINDPQAVPTALVWDSMSETHKKLLFATVQRRVERMVNSGKTVNEKMAVQLEDYGVNTNEMRDLARKFRDLECHTAFVALEKREQDDDTGIVSYGPDLTDKLAKDILGYVDIICHTYTKDVAGEDEPEYWGDFRKVGQYVGGDRFHALPPKLINPSMDRIIAYVNGDLDLESDEMMQGRSTVIEAQPARVRPAPVAVQATDGLGNEIDHVLEQLKTELNATEISEAAAIVTDGEVTKTGRTRPPKPVVA